jgi:hypothetical protein
MRDKQNNPVENDRNKNESRHTDISSENIRNAHASGDGSLSRSDMSFPEKNERFNAGEDEQEQEQNY